MVVMTEYTLVIVAVNMVDMHDTINMTDFIADMTNTFQDRKYLTLLSRSTWSPTGMAEINDLDYMNNINDTIDI